MGNPAVTKVSSRPSCIVKLRTRPRPSLQDQDSDNIIIVTRSHVFPETEHQALLLLESTERKTQVSSASPNFRPAFVSDIANHRDKSVERHREPSHNQRQSLASFLEPDPLDGPEGDGIVPAAAHDSCCSLGGDALYDSLTELPRHKHIPVMTSESAPAAPKPSSLELPPGVVLSAINPNILPIDPMVNASTQTDEAESFLGMHSSAGGCSSFEYQRGLIEHQREVDESWRQYRRKKRELDLYRLLSAGSSASLEYQRGLVEHQREADEWWHQYCEKERELDLYKLKEAERLARD